MNKQLNPELIGQENIPKALHGINPRTIMGPSKWQALRVNTIANHPYCSACGIETSKLDLHEDYDINYNIYTVAIKNYVPLCKDCHAFIHSGFMGVQIVNKQLSLDDARTILIKGLHLARTNKFKISAATFRLGIALKIDLDGISYNKGKIYDEFGPWKLLFEGKVYKGLNKQEWLAKYRKG